MAVTKWFCHGFFVGLLLRSKYAVNIYKYLLICMLFKYGKLLNKWYIALWLKIKMLIPYLNVWDFSIHFLDFLNVLKNTFFLW